MEEKINLVNERGDRIGVIGKLEAHETGKLHEAFSIFIFNEDNELLLQQRNLEKYHSGGLWSNTCCSHASAGELVEDAVHRRLKEEMGFDCELKKVDFLLYKANLENGLIEHEYDYLFVGQTNQTTFTPNPSEVNDYHWIGFEELKKDASNNPEKYTEWLKIIISDKPEIFSYR